MNIEAKAYYLKGTGEVILTTSEYLNGNAKTTKEEDVLIYPQLKDKNIEDIDFIELEYGTLATTVNNSKSYKVNLETKKLEVTYYAKEELEEKQKQIEALKTI